MRLVLALCIATLAAAPFVLAASSDVTFQAGDARCVRTGFGHHARGEATPSDPVVVASDTGTVTLQVLGKQVGVKSDDLGCSFDVAVTGGRGLGIDALSPRATVTPLSSTPCTPGGTGICIATATAEWAVSQLNTRASASVQVNPDVPPTSATDVDLLYGLNPAFAPSGALGVEVDYEIGVTVDGVRTVVATGAVQIYDSPVGLTVQGQSLP